MASGTDKSTTKIPIRDASGRFVKGATIKTTTSVSMPPANKPDFEKPLVSISVNNPFKRILYWLDEIRRRQTTTLAFKLSIPLIAIPIIVAAVFSLGRFYGINVQKERQNPSVPSSSSAPSVIPTPSVVDPNSDPITSRAGTLRIAVSSQTKYLLALRNGTLVVLDVPSTFDLTKYKDKQVLVTGTYNSTANVIKVTDIAEVQIFNPTTIASPAPESSPSAN